MRRGIAQRGLSLFLVPLILDLVLLLATLWFVGQEQQVTIKVDRYRKTMATSATIVESFHDVALVLGMFGVIHDQHLLTKYDRRIVDITMEMSQLGDLTRTDAEERLTMAKIAVLGNEAIGILDKYKQSLQQPTFFAVPASAEMSAVLDDLIAEIDGLIHDAAVKVRQDPVKAQNLNNAIKMIVGSAFVINLVFVILCLFFYRHLVARLGVLMDNTVRFSKHQPLNAPVSGEDEITRLDQTLHEVCDQLAQAIEYRQQILGVVSHELRAPLSSIHAFLGTIAASELPDTLSNQAAKAENNSQRLLEMINNLLDLERLEANKLVLTEREFELVDLFNNAIDSLESYALQRQVKLVPEYLELQARGDERLLTQTIINLLSNAIKFSPPGNKVKLRAEKLPHEVLEIQVIDNGPGVPDDAAGKLFNRFVQAERKEQGVGLGLAISRAIVEQHQGSIGMRKNPEGGSIFWFSLPLVKEQSSSDAAQTSAVPPV